MNQSRFPQAQGLNLLLCDADERQPLLNEDIKGEAATGQKQPQ